MFNAKIVEGKAVSETNSLNPGGDSRISLNPITGFGEWRRIAIVNDESHLQPAS